MRNVVLPAGIAGQLYLHSMPGRFEPWADIRAEIVAKHIACVVCLTPMDEVLRRSPDYARAIQSGPPWDQVMYPIADFGVPSDLGTLWALAQNVASRLRDGQNILIHCGAGIGRTGLMAAAVLMALDVPLPQAQEMVRNAGATAETPGQEDFLRQLAQESAE